MLLLHCMFSILYIYHHHSSWLIITKQCDALWRTCVDCTMCCQSLNILATNRLNILKQAIDVMICRFSVWKDFTLVLCVWRCWSGRRHSNCKRWKTHFCVLSSLKIRYENLKTSAVTSNALKFWQSRYSKYFWALSVSKKIIHRDSIQTKRN